MPPNVHLLGTDRVLSKLRMLGRDFERAAATALNKTAFEILDAEQEHIQDKFEFASATTEGFLGRSFYFPAKARPDKLEVEIVLRPGGIEKRSRILGQQTAGGEYDPSDPGRFPLGKKEDLLVIPVDVKRTGRGKFPAGQLPAKLLASGKAFRRGRVIVETGTGRVLYALVPKIKLRPELHLLEVALAKADDVFAQKVDDAVSKILGMLPLVQRTP